MLAATKVVEADPMAITLAEVLDAPQFQAPSLPVTATDRLADGLQLTAHDLKALLQIQGATDAELIQVLRQRFARARASSGCGLCGD